MLVIISLFKYRNISFKQAKTVTNYLLECRYFTELIRTNNTWCILGPRLDGLRCDTFVVLVSSLLCVFQPTFFLVHANNQERAWNVKNPRVMEINCNLKHSIDVKLQDCKKIPGNYGSLIQCLQIATPYRIQIRATTPRPTLRLDIVVTYTGRELQ